MPVRRFDRVAPVGGRARVDAQTGFLHSVVRPTRTGVFAYRLADGSVSHELRHPDDVFDEASLATLERIVVTRGHPRRADGLPVDVNTTNVKELQIGHGGDKVRRVSADDEDHPEIDVTITDAEAIDSIVNRRRDQVSMGYLVDIVDEQGVYKGQPYSKRHRSIRYNHLAADIDAGRGGATVAMLLDEADGLLVEPEHEQRSTTVKLKIDGLEADFADAGLASIVKTALERRDQQIETYGIEARERCTELEKAQAKLDQALADLDKHKTAPPPDVQGDVLAVLRVLDSASRLVELDDAKRDALLQLDGEGDLPARIRREVVIAALPTEKATLAKKTDAYIEARFDALLADAERTGEVNQRTGKALLGARARDDKRDDTPDLTSLLNTPYDALDVMSRVADSEATFVIRR